MTAEALANVEGVDVMGPLGLPIDDARDRVEM